MSQQSTIQNITLHSAKIKLDKTQFATCKHLIPDTVNQCLSFEITNSNYAIANGLRRTIKSEIPMKYLTVSMADIFSTDPYVTGDVIRKRIEMIPIPQDTPVDSTYSIRFENKSDTYVDVLSSEIKQRGGTTPVGFIQAIPIVSINSYQSFVVENITVSETQSYINSRVTAARVGYNILDHDMHTESSINSDPKHFYLEVETPGNIDPRYIVRTAIDSLIKRLRSINYSLSKTEYNVYKLMIPNETHTIGNLLSRYIYMIEPTIDYVAMRIVHPSKREVVIDIRHPQSELLCKKAATRIIEELTSMRIAFK